MEIWGIGYIRSYLFNPDEFIMLIIKVSLTQSCFIIWLGRMELPNSKWLLLIGRRRL